MWPVCFVSNSPTPCQMGKSWDNHREEVADHIISTVDKHAPGFAGSVLGRQVLSPLDLERKFALVGGDIFSWPYEP